MRFTSPKPAAKNILIPALLACAPEAQAQSTFHFTAALRGANEVPPDDDPTVGTGTFLLTGNSLSFLVDVPAVTFISLSGYIQGPALAGANAPILFDLGGPLLNGGSQFGLPPYYAFFSPFDGTFGAGPFAPTDPQVKQLESGLWYVNITSETIADGQLRGQILEVPEPSTVALIILAGRLMLLRPNRSRN